jgi:hypothetical protein
MRNDPGFMSVAEWDVLRERDRQRLDENWSHEHDDAHVRGEMSNAAACYAIQAAREAETGERISKVFRPIGPVTTPFHLWPWDMSWWKPRSMRENLVRAAALLIAEIERIDRADEAKKANS